MAFYTNFIQLAFFDEDGKVSQPLAESAYETVVSVLKEKEYDVTNHRDPKHPSKRLIDDMSIAHSSIEIDGNLLGYFYPGGETIRAEFLQKLVKRIPGVSMDLGVQTWETYSSSSIGVEYDSTTNEMTESYMLENNDGYCKITDSVFRYENGAFTLISRTKEDLSHAVDE